ncbi:vacuolar ATP synthase subunit S1-domain-containing protein [Mycena galopus ATCC 62051]|nr:vacuolar ATP synthase subunit S1-domain-containing protein [Mycena galopus ATCC 62051]
MSVRFLTVAGLLPLALAFSGTSPVVSWSSHSSSVLDALPSKVSDSFSLLDTILSSNDICGHDAIVLVDQPELHASDLRGLPSTTHLVRSLSSSPSSRQFPYVPTLGAPLDLSALLTSAATRCDSTYVALTAGQGGISHSHSGARKHVISLALPPLAGLAQERQDAMLEHDTLLSTELAALASMFPNHLVIYTASSAPALARRQTPLLANTILNTNANSTTGGILAHYQLLTPGIISGLLVSLFVLLPIVMFGIQALASIQSPLRNEIPRGFDAAEKKNQ